MNFIYTTVARKIGAEYAKPEEAMLAEMGADGWLLTAVRDEHQRGEQSVRVYYFAKDAP